MLHMKRKHILLCPVPLLFYKRSQTPSLFNKQNRRKVLRLGAAYAADAWLIILVVETIFPVCGLSEGSIRLVVALLTIGLLPVLVLAWVTLAFSDATGY